MRLLSDEYDLWVERRRLRRDWKKFVHNMYAGACNRSDFLHLPEKDGKWHGRAYHRCRCLPLCPFLQALQCRMMPVP